MVVVDVVVGVEEQHFLVGKADSELLVALLERFIVKIYRLYIQAIGYRLQVT